MANENYPSCYPFHAAVLNRDIDKLDKLDKSAINDRWINKDYANGFTPLMLAVSRTRKSSPHYQKFFDITKKLVEMGADLNVQMDHNKQSALFVVNDNEMVKFLLEKGANPNLTDLNGQTAVMKYVWDTYSDNFDIIKQFVDHGVDLLIKDNHDKNTLYLATINSNRGCHGGKKIVDLIYDETIKQEIKKSSWLPSLF